MNIGFKTYMVNRIFKENAVKKALSQAKILAIDRNKGRVTLAMKNGLISTGTYLYDLNDLRVGMIVLIGKVSGTYVIMNKVEANPKNSSGMSSVKPAPVVREIFKCNFDGMDGATTWIEEAQGLIPDNLENVEIDTAQYYSGSASLRFSDNSYVNYWDFLFPNNFIYSIRFLIPSGSALWYFEPLYTNGFYPRINCYYYYSLGVLKLVLYVNGNESILVNSDTVTTISYDVWHEFKITVFGSGREILITIDDDVVGSGIALSDNAFEGLNGIEWVCRSNNFIWLDKVLITTTDKDYTW
jgi:hypothetical protein